MVLGLLYERPAFFVLSPKLWTLLGLSSISAGGGTGFSSKYLCEMAWTRVAKLEPDLDDAFARLTKQGSGSLDS